MKMLVVILEYCGMPPVGLAVLALVAVILTPTRHRLGTMIAVVSLIGLLLLATPAISGALIASLETGLPMRVTTDDPPRIIMVLGGDVALTEWPKVAEEPGALSLERVRVGAMLERSTGLPVFIVGGPLAEGEQPISMIMKSSMEDDFHVPVAWTETRSLTTWQNAEYSAPMLRSMNIGTVYVVTQGWHMRRAVLAFRHFGIRAIAYPTRLDRYPPLLQLRYYLPLATAWLDSYYAFHEYVGYVYYSFLSAHR